MNFIVFFMSFILPLQIHSVAPDTQLAPAYWAVVTVIDSAIILGVANSRNRVPLMNMNPELLFRDFERSDQPKTRRKQLIENYVNNNFLITTK